MRAGLFADRSQFYKDLAMPFYGANRPGANVSQGLLDQFWLWSMQAGLKNAYECIKAFSETDFTEDLKKFDVPTLVLHGEDDQIVPVNDSARKSARLITGAKRDLLPGRAARPDGDASGPESTPTCSPSCRAESRPPPPTAAQLGLNTALLVTNEKAAGCGALRRVRDGVGLPPRHGQDGRFRVGWQRGCASRAGRRAIERMRRSLRERGADQRALR